MKIPKNVLSIGLFVLGGVFTTLATWLDVQDTIESVKEMSAAEKEEDENEDEEE